MNASFVVDHAKLAADPRFAALAERLAPFSPIDSAESFNRYCRNACQLWREQLPERLGRISPRFAELKQQIGSKSNDVIKTGWGGVVITLHEHPRVEKYLVINNGRYLALERHEQKDEHLEVREGAGLVLWRESASTALIAEPLLPNKSFHFEPGMEHCLIGTEDLLVFERSTDPKGMDRDLIFIFEPA
jgi:hypothetical protein